MADFSPIDITLSRRDFLKCAAVAASAPGSVPAIVQNAAARNAVIPLYAFLSELNLAKKALSATIPRVNYQGTVIPPTKHVSSFVPFLRQLAGQTQALLASHPIAQQAIDELRTVRNRFFYDCAMHDVNLVLAHPASFTREIRQAAFRLKQSQYEEDNKQFERDYSSVLSVLEPRRGHSTSISEMDIERRKAHEQIRLASMQHCVDFMHNMGLSKERVPLGQKRMVPNQCPYEGLERSSDAENFTLRMWDVMDMPHHPSISLDLSVLGDPQRLLNYVCQHNPLFHASMRRAVSHKKRLAEMPHETQVTAPPTEAQSLSPEEFIQQFADHPNIIAALGNGMHAEKLARSMGSNIITLGMA